MKPKDFPTVPEALLKELDRLFPERCPDPNLSDREVWIKVGQREVVRFLLKKFEIQNENILAR